MGYIKERHGMMLMPTKPGVCPECGSDHEQDMPHNRDALLYQYTFYDKHGCWPSWADAMAHCPDDVKAAWIRELKLRGIDVGEVAETMIVGIDLALGEDHTCVVDMGGE